MKYEQSEQIACILRLVFRDIGRSVSASFSLHHRDDLLVFVFRHVIDNQLPMSEPLKRRERNLKGSIFGNCSDLSA